MGELTLIGAVPRGRPTLYTEALGQLICERIAEGEALKHICTEEGMPKRMTVYDWLDRHPEFSRAFARAREAQADLEVDDTKEIADDFSILPEHKAHMIKVRMWRAERMHSRRYGSKVLHEHHAAEQKELGAEELPAGLAFLHAAIEQPKGEEA